MTTSDAAPRAKRAARIETAPTGRHLLHPSSVRLLGAGLGLLGGVALVAGVAWWVSNGFLAGDTLTYWLAGQRVNVGHDVYLLTADDPWLFDFRPHGLYGPPLIVVPWLALQALPGSTGMLVWWVAMAFAAFWAAAVVVIGTRGWAGVLALPLVPAYALMVGVGNVDGAVLAGLVGAWLVRDRPRALGVLIGTVVSLKLTPAVLVVWLVATGRWRALAWATGTGVALAALTMAVLGPDIFADYLGVIASVGSSRPRSFVLLAAMLAAVLLLGRRWPALAFALAIVAIPIGSPAPAGHTWVLALAAAAPAIVLGVAAQDVRLGVGRLLLVRQVSARLRVHREARPPSRPVRHDGALPSPQVDVPGDAR